MISVFTPLSATGNRYIEATFETLLAQTYTDWEWVVLENHGGKLPEPIRQHPKVKCHQDDTLEGIGAIKRRCCELSGSEYLFELDHDDLLHPDALMRATEALFDADFAYSDFAEFKDETWKPNLYGTGYGWTSYPVEFQGHVVIAYLAPPVTAQNIRLVDWAPNHLRAFRKDSYWSVGGHDEKLLVADDHDLIVRFFLKGMRFKHIPECLYFYRVYPDQTVSQKNALIRSFTQQVYNKSIFDLAESFADRSSPPLKKIDLCGGIDPCIGYEPLDLSLGHDLNQRWPLDDDSVGIIRAYDAIEHLKDPIHLMNEAYRVLAPGGFFMISVPSTDGRGAWQDPTHVSFWNENSFWYYTKRSHARYVPRLAARFQIARLHTWFPNDFCREHKISYVEAHLIALKEGYQPMGAVEI